MGKKIWRRRHLLFVGACLLVGVKYVTMSNAGPYTVRDLDLKQLTLNINENWMQPFRNTVQKMSGPKRRIFNVDCRAIIDGDQNEINRALAWMMYNTTKRAINDSKYITLTEDCDTFIEANGYNDQILSREELEFPIAYSILLYEDVEQAEKLLRVIYKPHNYYCIHVDADSDKVIHNAIEGVAGCFDNVFVVTRREYIVYAGFTRLQADLNCMSDLLYKGKKWKYFINLPSQEFPLKTNREIVEILKIYNGANDIEGITGVRALHSRYQYRYIYKHVNSEVKPKLFNTNIKKDDPPYNISVVKGSAYGVFSREFIEFVAENKIARELLDWFRDVFSPDEYYWATLHHNTHIGTPGAYKGKPDDKPWLAVYASWGGRDPCQGKFVRGVCVFGVGDLSMLVKLPYLFANKFHRDFQPLALDCMEEWIYNRTFEKNTLNLTYYKNLPFIRKEKWIGDQTPDALAPK